MKPKKEYISSRGEKLRSAEELHFSWWLDELGSAGIISGYRYEPKTYELCEKKTFMKRVQMKTKVKFVEKTILQSHTYTPDFTIFWNTIKHNLLKSIAKVSTVDVKGGYSRNYNDTAFPLNQKWMYDKFGIYVEKVVSGSSTYKNSKKELVIKKGLFAKTFTPKRYLLTDVSKIRRKIKFNVVLLEDYILKMNQTENSND